MMNGTAVVVIELGFLGPLVVVPNVAVSTTSPTGLQNTVRSNWFGPPRSQNAW